MFIRFLTSNVQNLSNLLENPLPTLGLCVEIFFNNLKEETCMSNQRVLKSWTSKVVFRVERPIVNLNFTNKQTDHRLNSWSRRCFERESVLSFVLLLSCCQAHLRFRVEHPSTSNLQMSTGLLSCQIFWKHIKLANNRLVHFYKEQLISECPFAAFFIFLG